MNLDPQVVVIVVLIPVAVTLVAYAFLVAGGKTERHSRLMERLGQAPQVEQISAEGREPGVAEEIVKRAAPVLARPVMPKTDVERSNLRVRMANAGYRRESAPAALLASKVVFGLLALGISLLITWERSCTYRQMFAWGIFCGGLAFMLPNLWLAISVSARQEKITNGLPDALDLMVVCVEAGLGLDQAIQHIGDELAQSHPELAEEFRITTIEKQVGLPRAQAMKNLTLRTGVPDMKALCGMLIQAERFGTSIAKALRTHAAGLRVKRRQRAEERAAKTSVKLTFPLVLFIFPCIFAVSAGPAAIKIIETLGQGR